MLFCRIRAGRKNAAAKSLLDMDDRCCESFGLPVLLPLLCFLALPDLGLLDFSADAPKGGKSLPLSSGGKSLQSGLVTEECG
jgi:hypothetical protein